MERIDKEAKRFTTLSIQKLKCSTSICTFLFFFFHFVSEKSMKINQNCFPAVLQTTEQRRAESLYMDIYVCNSKRQQNKIEDQQKKQQNRSLFLPWCSIRKKQTACLSVTVTACFSRSTVYGRQKRTKILMSDSLFQQQQQQQ